MFCARVTVMALTTQVPWLRCVSGACCEGGRNMQRRLHCAAIYPILNQISIKLKIMLTDYELLFSILT